MTIRIDGGTVVGWSGDHHELIPEGSVVIVEDGSTSTNTSASHVYKGGKR